MCIRLFLVGILLFLPSQTDAWSGYDRENRAYIEVFTREMLRLGQEIELYDWNTHKISRGRVISIENPGGPALVGVLDYGTHTYRIFEIYFKKVEAKGYYR